MECKYYLIGEFSEQCGISKRMLRYFDKLAILTPSFTDTQNGYRYYDQKQIQSLQKIKHLQCFGFSLKVIKEILSADLDFPVFLDLLKDQEVHLRNEKDEMTHHLLKLQSFINYIESNPSNMDEIQYNTFEIERSTPMHSKTLIKERLYLLPSSLNFLEKIEESSPKHPDIPKYFITFDIDKFMYINEDYGYPVGDQVIYQIFSFIDDYFKPLLQQNVDNSLSRLGGDEFALYLVNPNHKEILDTTKKVLDSIREFPYETLGCSRKVTSSCGIAKINHYEHPQDYRHISSKALLEAKRAGSDCYRIIEK